MADLITLSEYKTYKKITKTENDDQLNLIIASISALVKTYCGHSFTDYYSTNKVEYINIEPSQHAILLNEWPIKEVVSIETIETDNSYSLLDTSYYFVDKAIDTIFMRSGYWPQGYGSVRITYKAGYQTTPEEVKIATLDLVSHYFKEEFKERKAIGSTSIDNGTYFSSSKWPSHIVRVLDLYRNV